MRTSLLQVKSAKVLPGGVVEIDTTGGDRFKWSPKPGRRLSGRLQYSTETHEAHEKLVRELTRTSKCPHDSPELECFIAPILKTWAAKRRQRLRVIEFGPAHTTQVPEALAANLTSYTAIDYSEPFLCKQKELLGELPGLARRCQHIVANTYDVVLAASSADLVFTSCHPPLVSAPVEDKCAVIEKVHAVLDDEGVFVVFPWYFAEQQTEVSECLLRMFHLRQIAFIKGREERQMLFLHKNRHAIGICRKRAA